MVQPGRRKWLKQLSLVLGGISLAPIQVFSSSKTSPFLSGWSATSKTSKEKNMKTGAFSMSLSVKDLKTSKEFYEHLGFHVFGGDMKSNYLIMKNGNALIGLFQGMFTGNIITFNPGWDENAQKLEKFNDVREIQQHIKQQGFKLESEADEKTTGPASFMLRDPDGNLILFDQHV